MTFFVNPFLTPPTDDVSTHSSEVTLEELVDAIDQSSQLYNTGHMSQNNFRMVAKSLVATFGNGVSGSRDARLDNVTSLSQQQQSIFEPATYNIPAEVSATNQILTNPPPLEDAFAEYCIAPISELMESNDDNTKIEERGMTSKSKKQRKQEQKARASGNETQKTAWPFRNAAEGIQTTSRDEQRHIVLSCIKCRLLWVVGFDLGNEHPIMFSCNSKNVGASTICPECKTKSLPAISGIFDQSSKPFKAVTHTGSPLFDTSMEKQVKTFLGGDLTVLAGNGKVVFFEATRMANMAKEYGATISTIRKTA